VCKGGRNAEGRIVTEKTSEWWKIRRKMSKQTIMKHVYSGGKKYR
jgi:hypothetical protein